MQQCVRVVSGNLRCEISPSGQCSHRTKQALVSRQASEESACLILSALMLLWLFVSVRPIESGSGAQNHSWLHMRVQQYKTHFRSIASISRILGRVWVHEHWTDTTYQKLKSLNVANPVHSLVKRGLNLHWGYNPLQASLVEDSCFSFRCNTYFNKCGNISHAWLLITPFQCISPH